MVHQKETVYFYKDCKVFGNLLLGPTNVNALTTLNNKRDVSDSYSKSQMDTALYAKQATIALKSPLFWTLNPSVPYEMSADSYTTSQVDSALSAKANATDVYTKSQIDTTLSAKQTKAQHTLKLKWIWLLEINNPC